MTNRPTTTPTTPKPSDAAVTFATTAVTTAQTAGGAVLLYAVGERAFASLAATAALALLGATIWQMVTHRDHKPGCQVSGVSPDTGQETPLEPAESAVNALVGGS